MNKTDRLKQGPFRAIAHRLLVVGGVLLLCLPCLPGWTGEQGLISTYRLFNLTMFGVWLLITLSLNLLIGYSGQVSLGQAALVLCGAYLMAIFRQQGGIPLLLALGLTGLVTGLLGGVFIGLPAVRLRGPYLGIVTFALAVALPQLLKLQPLTPWTQGVRGIHWTPLYLPTALIGRFTGEQIRYAIILCFTIVLTTGFRNLTQSRLGRALVALREDELAAAYMGIDIRLHKALAFGISAFYAGIGGGLFFVVQGYVSPDSLGVFDSILLLAAVVIGGLGSLAGSLYGALFLTFHSELISALAHWLPHAESSSSLLLGVLLVLSGFIFPQGIAGFVRSAYLGK